MNLPTILNLVEQSQEEVYTDFDAIESLNVLNSKERTIIVLRYFEDCRLQDIAHNLKDIRKNGYLK